jgi:glycosyltransferase involved in cell wall biosynthesis
LNLEFAVFVILDLEFAFNWVFSMKPISSDAGSDSGNQRPDVSIVVPLYNEEENVRACCEEVRRCMEEAGLQYELVLVDDGSEDGTARVAEDICRGDRCVRLIELRRNFGQTAAMAAGFDNSTADIVVPMDGDLQNDPADIPRLMAMLEEEALDVVSGWRRERQDPGMRRLASGIANRLISMITGVSLHDYGCTLKAYRRDVLEDVNLYGEMHRFLPALVHWVGGRVGEMPVNHRPRQRGSSKYGYGRIFKVLVDLLTVKFMMDYLTKPLYFFGKVGLWSFLLAILSLGVVVGQKLVLGTDMTGNPLLYLSVLLVIMGVQFVLMGLMTEILARTYHESQGRKTYKVRRVISG